MHLGRSLRFVVAVGLGLGLGVSPARADKPKKAAAPAAEQPAAAPAGKFDGTYIGGSPSVGKCSKEPIIVKGNRFTWRFVIRDRFSKGSSPEEDRGTVVGTVSPDGQLAGKNEDGTLEVTGSHECWMYGGRERCQFTIKSEVCDSQYGAASNEDPPSGGDESSDGDRAAPTRRGATKKGPQCSPFGGKCGGSAGSCCPGLVCRSTPTNAIRGKQRVMIQACKR